MIPKPIISDAFTLEDIRKIRDYNDEIASTLTLKEYCEYINRKTEPFVQAREMRLRARASSAGYSEPAAP
jgi:hypothetical protein